MTPLKGRVATSGQRPGGSVLMGWAGLGAGLPFLPVKHNHWSLVHGCTFPPPVKGKGKVILRRKCPNPPEAAGQSVIYEAVNMPGR